MATYPLTGLSVDLMNQAAVTKDYRDSGYVQGTAVVRDGNFTRRSVDLNRIQRTLDMSLMGSSSTIGATQSALAIADVLQTIPVSKGDIILGVVAKVERAASATCNLNIGTAGGSNLLSTVNAAALGTVQAMLTTPISITAEDTVDVTFGPSTTAFDAKVTTELIVVPAPR